MRWIFLIFLCFSFVKEARSECPLALILMQKNRPDVAIKEFVTCGELYGDIDSLYKVGEMFQNGTGIEPSFERAAKYYRLAANMGYAPAQLKIGGLYWTGDGVKQDLKKAYMWIFLASEDASKRWYYAVSLAYEQKLSVNPVSEVSVALGKMDDYFKSKKDETTVKRAKQEANAWKYRRLQDFAKKVLGDEYPMFEKNLKSNGKDDTAVAKILADLKSRAKEAGIIK